MPTPPPAAELTRRTFLADGLRWTVHEIEAPHLPPGERRRCLIFACDAVMRRVYAYPADWGSADAATLWALSHGR
jgi:hypothetical protein